MKKILKFLNDYLEETICIILMSVMTIIIFIQVIMRYVMHNSLSWSEELARYCFVWLIYIGVAYGCKLMKHIKIDAALKLFPEKSKTVYYNCWRTSGTCICSIHRCDRCRTYI